MGIEPYKYGWDGKQETLLTGCANDGVFCTVLIQLNDWTVPKDYPFKF